MKTKVIIIAELYRGFGRFNSTFNILLTIAMNAFWLLRVRRKISCLVSSVGALPSPEDPLILFLYLNEKRLFFSLGKEYYIQS